MTASALESMRMLAAQYGLKLSDAKTAVIESDTWRSEKDRIFGTDEFMNREGL